LENIIQELQVASFLENIDNKTSEMNMFVFEEDINPKRLYLYLNARFGRPNGMLSLFRNEYSDGGLFHWHYTLKYKNSILHIMCGTYRLEVFISNNISKTKEECKYFLDELIKDTSTYSLEYKKVKKGLENWIQIINPFNKLKNQISNLFEEVDNLFIKLESIKSENLNNRSIDGKDFSKWANLIDDYSSKCFLIRCLIPVYIETFINLILHVGSSYEIKEDKATFDLILRKKINERVLYINNCIGIQKEISIDDIEWKNVHTIFNNRNDLLHGNININKLKYGEVSFIKNMPLFSNFSSFRDELLSNSYYKYKDLIELEIESTERFFYYVLFSFEIKVAEEIKTMLTSHSLGYNDKTKRFGILFSDNMIDFTTDLDKVKNIDSNLLNSKAH